MSAYGISSPQPDLLMLASVNAMPGTATPFVDLKPIFHEQSESRPTLWRRV